MGGDTISFAFGVPTSLSVTETVDIKQFTETELVEQISLICPIGEYFPSIGRIRQAVLGNIPQLKIQCDIE